MKEMLKRHRETRKAVEVRLREELGDVVKKVSGR